MPKLIPENELDAVHEVVARFPEGAAIEEVSGALAIKMSRRTLQRRLALLVEQKRLIVEGQGRASHYKLSPIGVELQVPPGRFTVKGHAARVEIYIPISPEAEAIKQAVREPIQNRSPIGYNRAFLDEFRPNETFYLSAETRQRLLEMGGRRITSARLGLMCGKYSAAC
jgi:hypothetical protein